MNKYPTKDTDDEEVYQRQANKEPTFFEKHFPIIAVILAIVLIMVTFSFHADAQVGTPIRWATGKTITNVVFLARENGNYVQFGIEGQDWNKVSFWILKSQLVKVATFRDTVRIPTICPACPVCPSCPPAIDPKTTQAYKDLAKKLTDANQMLAQEIILVNTYQATNDKLEAERLVLIAELRKYKDELLKYKPVTILVPRDSL